VGERDIDLDDLEALIARLAEDQRGGQSVEEITSTWRFAGILDTAEVAAWLRVGVFDGHRAGLLRMAGVRASDLERLPRAEGRPLGFAFAMGQLSVKALIGAIDRSVQDPEITSVRLTPLGGMRCAEKILDDES